MSMDLINEAPNTECKTKDKLITSITKKSIDYINSHITDANLNELAKKLGYTNVYTSVIIKKLFGRPFSKLLIDARCNIAAELLCTTNMPIKQIISSIGYENETFFRKVFKEHFGASPAKYRKDNKKI